MKGRISDWGALLIQRGKEEREMVCPYSGEGQLTCGDRCPLFGEPQVQNGITVLELCNAVLYFKEFEDERPKSEVEHQSFDGE